MNMKGKVNRAALSDKGFSLIELLVVIAVLAIVAGGTMVGVGMLSRGDAKKASKEINSQLDELRTNTLSVSADWSAEISNSGGTYKIEIKKSGATYSQKTLGARIDILYDDVKLSDGDIVKITYEKSTGKVASVSVNGTAKSLTSDKYGTINCVSSSTEYKLKLWYETGRITSDY